MLSINLIGSGNLGNHLLKALSKSNEVVIKQWLNRSETTTDGGHDATEVVREFSELDPANLTIIAVSDDAIKGVSQQIPYQNQLVVHTSGSVGIHDLDPKHRRGVFYPVQTFSKKRAIDFRDVPFCLEALDKNDLNLLVRLAEELGSSHYKISTEQRATVHLAAVFVNNFVNHLYRVGHEITDAKSINFDILKPLISETAKKVQELSPYQSQTGPAKRDDKKTIKRHLKILEDKEHKKIYELLTEAIQKTHGRKKL